MKPTTQMLQQFDPLAPAPYPVQPQPPKKSDGVRAASPPQQSAPVNPLPGKTPLHAGRPPAVPSDEPVIPPGPKGKKK